jgi:post-segregation antitoxin (ccd killing protein)
MTVRTTITLDDADLEACKSLGVNVSAAARAGIRAALKAADAEADRKAYVEHPEHADDPIVETQAWADDDEWPEFN